MLRRLPVRNPASRFESVAVEYDGAPPDLGLTLYEDQSRSILSENKSPDLSFRFSVNAYRGCSHGCAYCYARPSHEYLGWGSGVDFERRILFKPRAAELLRTAFERESWQGELVVFSGNTDAYQPLEAQLRLTRACLEVCRDFGNPVHIITKGTLVERDVDVLCQLHAKASVGVSVSVTFWDAEVCRVMEPYAPPPKRRIETIRRLSQAGLPVMVHVAPLIPGLSDSGVIPILEAAREAGAISVMAGPVRLPGSAAQVFEERLREGFPQRAEKVLRRITEMRGGSLNDSRFFERFNGQGRYSDALSAVVEATSKRLGYGQFPAPRSGFSRPSSGQAASQLSLFS